MKIFVTAKPKSKKESVEKIDDSHFVVAVKERPEKGEANYAILAAVAEYFRVTLADVRLVSGFSSKQKVIEVRII